MAVIGLSVSALGGFIVFVAGASRGDWAVAGLGLALAGIGLLLWELTVAVAEGREPAEAATIGER